jgi:hypothetical protein
MKLWPCHGGGEAARIRIFMDNEERSGVLGGETG